MQKTISIIIPSCNRTSLLKNTIDKIQNNFKVLNFNNYEIIVINNGYSDFLNIGNENITIHNIEERMDPGVARNYGIDNSDSEWVWFVDDDDEVYIENLDKVINLINESENDLIVHSLKLKYKQPNINYSLIKNVVSFKEKQEVFNYIFRRKIINNSNIKFSKGLHEDIRYVTQLLLSTDKIEIIDSKIYNKIQRDDSITKELNTNRIDGYINAISEIINIDNEIISELKSEIVLQSLGTMLYLINKSNNKEFFLTYLNEKFPNELEKR